ncbi:MAG: hypothetical protein BWK80_11595 [Desulfobacteraceae bacterium IS3]|nr:MAG: hypothetical protein BWK80_11595 [Desulfobacteraceae bacterium IS3]
MVVQKQVIRKSHSERIKVERVYLFSAGAVLQPVGRTKRSVSADETAKISPGGSFQHSASELSGVLK